MKYVCLLRGINVGGKNKVSMSDLKNIFLDLEFENVSTYINSGNVLFSSSKKTNIDLINVIEKRLAKEIAPLKVVVCSQNHLKSVLINAPKSWGHDDSQKHNLLFIRPPLKAQQVLDHIGKFNSELESVSLGDGVIYWSASLKDFGKTASSRLTAKPIYQEVTVRNYNTSVKLLKLLDD
jgi:uncharacterized protein (DUF1697 family)